MTDTSENIEPAVTQEDDRFEFPADGLFLVKALILASLPNGKQGVWEVPIGIHVGTRPRRVSFDFDLDGGVRGYQDADPDYCPLIPVTAHDTGDER